MSKFPKASYSKDAKITVPEILSRKNNRRKIVALTAYDYSMARLLDAANVDIILVGDSLGNVVQGNESTLPVTLDEMIYHTRCVSRGTKRALLVADMPFMSYQVSAEQALHSAGRLIKEGGASAVKLEGGENIARSVKALVDIDIPVMGHIGLMPQALHRMGGYKVQGRDDASRTRVLNDALAITEAGAFSLVIEGVEEELASEISAKVSIPTIGIGAGVSCDGQILVTWDMLGLCSDFRPKFVKRYLNLWEQGLEAINTYSAEVRSGEFPSDEHSFKAKQAIPLLKV